VRRRNLFGSTLRIASGHHNLRFGILPPNPPDGRPRILIRRCRHGAGIKDDDRSQRRHRGARKATLLELAFESGSVGLRGAASEVFYVVSRHVSMLAHGPVCAHFSRCSRETCRLPADQADAAVLRELKHSRQKTGRPWVGRKGTVVSFPQPEQVAWVSTLV